MPPTIAASSPIPFSVPSPSCLYTEICEFPNSYQINPWRNFYSFEQVSVTLKKKKSSITIPHKNVCSLKSINDDKFILMLSLTQTIGPLKRPKLIIQIKQN